VSLDKITSLQLVTEDGRYVPVDDQLATAA
jgi:hypothetical protein